MTWGIIIALLSIPLLHQSLKLRDILALLITYIGVFIIIIEGDFTNLHLQSPQGVILALSSAFIWSFYWIFNTKDNQETIIRLFYNFFFGLVWISIYYFTSDKISLPSPGAFLSALYVGAFEYGFTFILWLTALKLIDRTVKISIMIYLVPFISFLFISTLLNEKILPSSIIGAFLIAAGIIYHKSDELKLFKNNTPSPKK
jgi:drug/metabolite transporter (DMT)-like permease